MKATGYLKKAILQAKKVFNNVCHQVSFINGKETLKTHWRSLAQNKTHQINASEPSYAQFMHP